MVRTESSVSSAGSARRWCLPRSPSGRSGVSACPASGSSTRYYLAWAGLVCVLVYMASQWREIADMFRGRQARYGTLAGDERARRARHPGRRSTTSASGRTSAGTSPRTSSSACRTRAATSCEARRAAADHGASAAGQPDVPRLPRSAAGIRSTCRSRSRPEYIDPDKKPTVAAAERGPAVRHDRLQLQGPDRARHRRTPSRTSPTRSSRSVSGEQRKVYFTQGHGEKDTASSGARRLQRDRRSARSARTTPSRSSCSRSRARCRTMRRSWSSPGRRSTSSRARSTRSRSTSAKAGKLLLELDPPDKPDEPPLHQPDRAGAATGASTSATTSSSTPAAWDSCSAPTRRSPVAANYPSHPITERSTS